MRRFAMVAAALLSAGTLGAWVVQSTATPRPAATHTVTVGAICTDEGADSTWVDPWIVRIDMGDDVRWVLDSLTEARTVTVRPKARQVWPFAGSPPQGGRENPARSGAANRAGRHLYDILLLCEKPSGGTVQVVIDPEIVIGDE